MAEIFPTKNHEHVIITDIGGQVVGILTHPDVYFSMCERGLEQWCESHNVELIGMTMDFPDLETALLFKLTWGF